MFQLLPYRIQKMAYRYLTKRVHYNLDYPIISFTFDDVPSSSILGSQILEEYNIKGTFYVAGGLCDKETPVGMIASKSEIESLWKKGHEIANHTYNHTDCVENHPTLVHEDIALNCKMFSNIISDNFAFPRGRSNFRIRLSLKNQFMSCRGIEPGINRNLIDLLNLKAVRVYSYRGLTECFSYLSELLTNIGWLIFYTHDISPEPSEFGCKPDEFKKLVKEVNLQKIKVETVKQVLQAISKKKQ